MDERADGGTMIKRSAALIIGLALGLSAIPAMARNGQYLFREMARYQVPSGAAQALRASLLLHFDEATGSTNVVDSGKHGLAITSNGAFTTNTPSMFGNCGAFTANGRRFATQWTNDFRPGTNNWSIDLWIRADNAACVVSTQRYILGNDSNTSLRTWILIRRTTVPQYRIDLSTNGSSVAARTFEYDAAAVSNKWLHLAVWRYGDSLFAATNGALAVLSSTTLTGFNFSPTNTSSMMIGAPSGASAPMTFMDEVRYCVGEAMPYTTNGFTPPAAPYTGYE